MGSEPDLVPVYADLAHRHAGVLAIDPLQLYSVSNPDRPSNHGTPDLAVPAEDCTAVDPTSHGRRAKGPCVWGRNKLT